MIKSCNVAIYYRLIIYSNIKDVLFGQKWVAHETMILASEEKVITWTRWRTRSLIAKLKVVHKWVGLGRVQSSMLVLGRVGSGHFACGSGWVGSRKLDQRPTLRHPLSTILRCPPNQLFTSFQTCSSSTSPFSSPFLLSSKLLSPSRSTTVTAVVEVSCRHMTRHQCCSNTAAVFRRRTDENKNEQMRCKWCCCLLTDR